MVFTKFFIAMKKMSFNLHKWVVRAMVAVGAMMGISSCSNGGKVVINNPPETVYGPPPGVFPKRVEIVEDVYGPPVESIDSVSEVSKPEIIKPE